MVQYAVFLRTEALSAFLDLPRNTRDRVLTALEAIGNNPFIQPDIAGTADGICGLACDSVVIFYAVNHADSEVRCLAIETAVNL